MVVNIVKHQKLFLWIKRLLVEASAATNLDCIFSTSGRLSHLFNPTKESSASSDSDLFANGLWRPWSGESNLIIWQFQPKKMKRTMATLYSKRWLEQRSAIFEETTLPPGSVNLFYCKDYVISRYFLYAAVHASVTNIVNNGYQHWS